MEKTTKTGSQEAMQPKGGVTCVAVAGENFAILALDSKKADGKKKNRVFDVPTTATTSTALLGCGGPISEVSAFMKKFFEDFYSRNPTRSNEITVQSFIKMIDLLYLRQPRLPLAFAGVDSKGKGMCCFMDVDGSLYSPNSWAVGCAAGFIRPMLQENINNKKGRKLTIETAVEIIKDCFIEAGKHNIPMGTDLQMHIIKKGSTLLQQYSLGKSASTQDNLSSTPIN